MINECKSYLQLLAFVIQPSCATISRCFKNVDNVKPVQLICTRLFTGNRTVWEFGWAYGVGWGAAIFLFGAITLLLCDKESEEVYYKERKVMST